jgi:hypothetical protein
VSSVIPSEQSGFLLVDLGYLVISSEANSSLASDSFCQTRAVEAPRYPAHEPNLLAFFSVRRLTDTDCVNL